MPSWIPPAAAAVLVYLPFLRNGFVWLDHGEIVEGQLIVDRWRDLPSIFIDDRNFAGYQRPFYNLLHSLDHLLWGLEPAGFHFSSLLLHVGNVAMIVLLLTRAGHGNGVAAAIGSVWAVHPINTAAVGLIHAKADLLVTTMLCATLLILQHARRTGTWLGWGTAALATFSIALWTKETALVFPAGIFVACRLWDSQERAREHPLLSWTVLAGAIAIVSLAPRLLRGSFADSQLAIGERLLTFLAVYNEYVLVALVPQQLFIGDTVTRFSALATPEQVLVVAGSMVLLGAQAIAWRRLRWSRPWLLLWNLPLVPVCQLVPILHFRADRFLYLAGLGLVGLTVESVRRLLQVTAAHAAGRRQLMAIGTIVVVILFGIKSRNRLFDFKDDETLFSTELLTVPDYAEGASAMALHYDRKGQRARARTFWKIALQRSERRMSYLNTNTLVVNYSAHLLGMRRYQEAHNFLAANRASVAGDRERLEAGYNFAVATFFLGQEAKALEMLTGYVEHRPDDALAHYLLGRAAMRVGDRARARAGLQRYLALSPNAGDRGVVETWLTQQGLDDRTYPSDGPRW